MVADGTDFLHDPAEGIRACVVDATNDIGYISDYAQTLGLLSIEREAGIILMHLRRFKRNIEATLNTATGRDAADDGATDGG